MNKDYEDAKSIKNNIQYIKYSILEAIGVYDLSREEDIKRHCKSKKHYTDNSYNITVFSFENAGIISLTDTSSSGKLYKLTPKGIMLFEGIFQKEPVNVKIKA